MPLPHRRILILRKSTLAIRNEKKFFKTPVWKAFKIEWEQSQLALMAQQQAAREIAEVICAFNRLSLKN
jgi:hypothetical protein